MYRDSVKVKYLKMANTMFLHGSVATVLRACKMQATFQRRRWHSRPVSTVILTRHSLLTPPRLPAQQLSANRLLQTCRMSLIEWFHTCHSQHVLFYHGTKLLPLNLPALMVMEVYLISLIMPWSPLTICCLDFIQSSTQFVISWWLGWSKRRQKLVQMLSCMSTIRMA